MASKGKECAIENYFKEKNMQQVLEGVVAVKVKDRRVKRTLCRPFSIGGPLQISITND